MYSFNLHLLLVFVCIWFLVTGDSAKLNLEYSTLLTATGSSLHYSVLTFAYLFIIVFYNFFCVETLWNKNFSSRIKTHYN